VIEPVTWVKVERPTLDLVGIVLGSLALAGYLAILTSGLGLTLGVLLRRARRREATSSPLHELNSPPQIQS